MHTQLAEHVKTVASTDMQLAQFARASAVDFGAQSLRLGKNKVITLEGYSIPIVHIGMAYIANNNWHPGLNWFLPWQCHTCCQALSLRQVCDVATMLKHCCWYGACMTGRQVDSKKGSMTERNKARQAKREKAKSRMRIRRSSNWAHREATAIPSGLSWR